jgi:hypothetical protein
MILNMHHFIAVWNGKAEPEGVSIALRVGPQPMPLAATNHFGHGILTFNLNYLFRTSLGYNLWVKGPANAPKHAISPLEGIVETDWSTATFTMNWRFTAANTPVEFEPGEPICMIIPIRRGELESFTPELCDLTENSALHSAYEKWAASRAAFLKDLKTQNSPAVTEKWQKDYMHGLSPGGGKAPDHQTKLGLKEFRVRGHGNEGTWLK